jgi:hypothetical protein
VSTSPMSAPIGSRTEVGRDYSDVRDRAPPLSPAHALVNSGLYSTPSERSLRDPAVPQASRRSRAGPPARPGPHEDDECRLNAEGREPKPPPSGGND